MSASANASSSPDPDPVTGHPHAADLALRAPEPLAAFNRAGVLSAADVHVALTLLSLAGLPAGGALPGPVALGAALAVRAPRLGHVFVDLDRVAATVASEAVQLAAGDLGWPEPGAWRAALAGCDALVATGDKLLEGDPPAAGDKLLEGNPPAVGDKLLEADPPAQGDKLRAGDALRPLRLIGSRLYLDRYWRQERALAQTLRGLDAEPLRQLDLPLLGRRLAALFPDTADSAQRAAAAAALLRGLTVVAGGPGTGKTTTVARTVALLAETAAAAGEATPLIALCAPTGKAAARLGQAIGSEVDGLGISDTAADAVRRLGASTIHRLLGVRGEGRFRHDRTNPLPHDVVIVDETSMVSLSLISHLLAAVREDARVVLVGDPDQLSAIEAGAVLRDIVGPAAGGPCFSPGMRTILKHVTGWDAGPAQVDSDFGDGVVVLTRGHRFGAPIGALAEAIRAGDGTGAITALSADSDGQILWLDIDAAELPSHPGASAALREVIVAEFGALAHSARAGDVDGALDGLGRLRLLCAHRQGRYGVRNWTALVEQWLAEALGLVLEGDYAGRPLLLSENDYELRLYNGDSGVIVATPDGVSATFEHEDGVLAVAPARLAAVETAFASTIHKSQGSQFSTAVVVLPDPDSRLLTRELLYTAVTRAQRRLVVIGDERSLVQAVARPVARATGLRERLWGDEVTSSSG